MRASVVILVLCLAGVARAHPLDTGYLRVDAEGSAFAITFDIDVVVAGELLRVEEAELDAVLGSRANELADRTYRTSAPMAGDDRCTWGTATASRKGQTTTIAETATCPVGDLQWDLSFVKRLGATFQILGRVRAHGVEQVITIDKTQTAIAIGGSGDRFAPAILDGLAHAGVLPRGWPAGLEHVLLVIVLMLAAREVKRGAMTVWLSMIGVTVGGALATSISLPAAVPAILLALAIAAAAAVAVTGRHERHAWLLGALVGGCHGLGGAPVHWIGFDAGIALGHAAIALVLGVPLVLALGHARRAVPPVAIVCAFGAIAFVLKPLAG